jgi:hypothetical protein
VADDAATGYAMVNDAKAGYVAVGNAVKHTGAVNGGSRRQVEGRRVAGRR